MKTTIAFCIALVFLTQSVYSEKVLNIELEVYKNDSVIPKSIMPMDGNPTIYVVPGDYRLVLLNPEGEIILEKPIEISFIVMTDPPTPIDSYPLSLRLPYNPEMRILKLFNGDKEIFSTTIDVCNNDGVCQIGYENFLSCPDDCPLDKNDGICIKDADGVCDPDCSEGVDPDCVTVPTTTYEEIITTEITTDIVTTETTDIETTTTTIDKKEDREYLNYLPWLVLIVVIMAAILLYISRKKNKPVESDTVGEDKITSWIKEKLKKGEDPEVLKKGLEAEGYDPKIIDKVKREL